MFEGLADQIKKKKAPVAAPSTAPAPKAPAVKQTGLFAGLAESIKNKPPGERPVEAPVDYAGVDQPTGRVSGAHEDRVDKLAWAIAQHETGNRNIRGATGELPTRYQFMPATWRSWAGKYLGNPNAPATDANQDRVAKARIRERFAAGLDERQIAMEWNGGVPYRKVGTTTTTDGRTINYDTGRYADNVLRLMGRAPGGVRLASVDFEEPTPAPAPKGPMFSGLVDRVRKSEAQKAAPQAQEAPQAPAAQPEPKWGDLPPSLAFTRQPDLTFGSSNSTLQMPTIQQTTTVDKAINKVKDYAQKPGAVPAALRTVGETFKTVDDAMIRTGQDVDPETGKKKTAVDKAVDYARAGVAAVNLFPPFLAGSAVLQGAENLEGDGIAKTVVRGAAKGVNKVFETVAKASGAGAKATVAGYFDAYNTITRGLNRDRSQDVVPSQGTQALAEEAGGLAGLLLAGKLAHEAYKAPKEFKAKTMVTNDVVASAKNLLGIESAKNVLGQEKPVPVEVLNKNYRQLAQKLHPDKGGNAQTFNVVTHARDVLLDHASMSAKEFRAKYNAPLAKANQLIRELPPVRQPEALQAAPEALKPFEGLADRVKGKDATKALTEPKAVGKPTPEAPMLTLPEASKMPLEKIKFEDTPAHNEIMAELAFAERGKRVAVRNIDSSGMTFSAQKSTFPQWIPSELRRKPLLDAVVKHITEGTLPNKAAETRLYRVVAEKMNGTPAEAKLLQTARQNALDPFATDAENAQALVQADTQFAKEKSQAMAPATVETAAPEAPPATETKASKVGKSIEAKAVEQGLAKAFGETAQYDTITIKDQAARATKIVNEDFARARRIVNGEENLPEGLRAGALFKAVEDYAMKNKDPYLALELANSPLASATSIFAQELRLLAERDPDSATAAIQRLKKVKESAGKQVGRSKETVVEQIKESIKKETKAKATKETWASFIDKITC